MYETVAEVAVCDFVASVGDSGWVCFAACDTEKVAAVCEIEVTVAVYDSAEEAGGSVSAYSEECATVAYVVAEEVAAYGAVADASDVCRRASTVRVAEASNSRRTALAAIYLRLPN